MGKEIKYNINEEGCWICISHKPGNKGYPCIKIQGIGFRLNRLILEEKLNRTIKIGFMALHTCNNKQCINPDHLYEGTHKQNMEDLSRSDLLKGIKIHTHKLTEKNILDIRKSNLTHRELSIKYNVSKTNISYIKNNKIWSHLK